MPYVSLCVYICMYVCMYVNTKYQRKILKEPSAVCEYICVYVRYVHIYVYVQNISVEDEKSPVPCVSLYVCMYVCMYKISA